MITQYHKKRKHKGLGVLPERVITLGFGYLLVGGAVLGLGAYVWHKAKDDFGAKQDTSLIPDIQPKVKKLISPAIHTDSFPLKRGSRGSRVTQMQQALASILGSMDAYGGIDGQFGPGTESALIKAGYPSTINEATFNKLVGSNAGSTATSSSKQTASDLYNAAALGDADKCIQVLKRIKNVADYTAVNEEYKTVTDESTLIRYTIVNHLLNYAFSANEAAKTRIKAEFIRIGLKTDSSGKWSLSGIPMKKAIITMIPTWIEDASGRRLSVNKNVILGESLYTDKGMTWFKSIQNIVAKVPTSDIKYYNNL